MAKIIHSMIRVFKPDVSIEFYNKAFNLEVVERCDFREIWAVWKIIQLKP